MRLLHVIKLLIGYCICEILFGEDVIMHEKKRLRDVLNNRKSKN